MKKLERIVAWSLSILGIVLLILAVLITPELAFADPGSSCANSCYGSCQTTCGSDVGCLQSCFSSCMPTCCTTACSPPTEPPNCYSSCMLAAGCPGHPPCDPNNDCVTGSPTNCGALNGDCHLYVGDFPECILCDCSVKNGKCKCN